MDQTTLFSARLSTYNRQAIFYTKSKVDVQYCGHLKKAALSTITPIVAMSLLPIGVDAQCGVGGFVNASGVPIATPAPCDIDSANHFIDLNADGIADFRFRLASAGYKTLLEGLNSAEVFIFGPPSLPWLDTGTGANNPILGEPFINGFPASIPINYSTLSAMSGGLGNGAILNCNNCTYVMGANAIGNDFNFIENTPFVMLEVNGNLGFMHITLDTNGCPIIDFSQSGVDQEPHGNHIITGDCSTLPVELSNFNAKILGEAIQLEWTTNSEIENLGFELQRSTNGQDFTKLAWIAGYGTSTQTLQYRYKDMKAIANQNYYYRLKQIDFSGAIKYSHIITANIEKNIHISELVPNPVSTQATIQITVAKSTDASFSLFNVTGKTIYQLELNLEEGENVLKIPIDNLPGGNYYAKIRVADTQIYKKIIKQ